MNIFRNKTEQQKGFTLIELLVVISIISLLSSIVMSSLNTARAKARDAKRLSDVREINNAIQLYIADYNEAPLNNSNPMTISYNDGDKVERWDELASALAPYISELPVDPCYTCQPYETMSIDLPNGYNHSSTDLRYVYYNPIHTAGTGLVSPIDYYLFPSGFEKRSWNSFGFFFGSGSY